MIAPSSTEPSDPDPDIESHYPSRHSESTDIRNIHNQNQASINQDDQPHVEEEDITSKPGGSPVGNGSREAYVLRTIMKPLSRPGRSRMPPVAISSSAEPSNRGDDEGRPIGVPKMVNSAPTLAIDSGTGPAMGSGDKNGLAPRRNISILMPRKMGLPEDEENKVRKNFIEPSWKQCFISTIKAQPFLVGLPVLLPISWALHFSDQNPVAIFVTSLITIVPLAGGLSFATEELATRVGESWGGLLNASFGNAVELLIAIMALVKGELDIVQASMIGSILSNVLLVLGMSYFAGGLRFHEQLYTVLGAQMHISLLGISLMAIVMPAAYHYAFPSTSSIISETRSGSAPEGVELQNLLKMSRGLSFILLAVYAMFLTFQLYTHAYLFRLPREKIQHPLPGPVPHHQSVFPRPHWVDSMVDTSSSSSSSSGSSVTSNKSRRRFKKLRKFSLSSKQRDSEKKEDNGHEADTEGDASRVYLAPVSVPLSEHTAERLVYERPRDNLESVIGTAAKSNPHPHSRSNEDLERQQSAVSSTSEGVVDDEGVVHVQPKVKFWFAIGMLVLMTALAGVTAEWLVDSIDGLTSTSNISREFVGLILLPVIGNSVEHITAVTVSVKDKLNLSMSIAVGSSIQVSLCLLPILVLVGWAIGQPMLLFFDTFETIALVISILLVNFAISDGRTNYLEGFVMMMAYVSIALVCWFYDPVE